MKFMNLLFYFLGIIASYSFAQFTNVAIDTNTDDQSEPTIAASPLDSNIVLAAWNDFRDINGNDYSKPGYAFSTNSGQTWSNEIVLPPGYTNGFDPSVAFDRYDNAFYCYIASIGGLGPVYVSRTTSFQPPYTWNHKLVADITATTFNDKPFIAVDNTGGATDGRIYISWTSVTFSGEEIESYAIHFSYSVDNGDNFSTPQILNQESSSNDYVLTMPSQTIPSDFTDFDPAVTHSMPAVAPNGDVYVIWMDFRQGTNASSIKLRKSPNGGVTFNGVITAAQFTATLGIHRGLAEIKYVPSLTIDPTNGNLYIAYDELVSQDVRVKLKRTTNGGTSWETTTIGNFGTGWQYFPWVSVNNSGRIAVLFVHSPNSTTVDTYISESHDNGANFLQPIKVTSQSSNPSNAEYTHHYHGMTNVDGGYSYCIWNDYRNENADIYFSKVNPTPLAPTGFYITGGIGDNPTLHWDPNVELDLDGYNIYSRFNQGPWVLLITVDKYTTQFTDQGVTITGGNLIQAFVIIFQQLIWLEMNRSNFGVLVV